MSAILLPRRAWIYNFVQNRKHAEDLVSIQQSQSLSSPPETSALEALQHVGRQWSQSPVALTPQHEIKRHAQIIKLHHHPQQRPDTFECELSDGQHYILAVIDSKALNKCFPDGLRDLSSVKGALVAVTTCRLVVFQHAQKHHYRVRLLVEEFQLLGCEGCDVIGDPVYITDDEGIYRRLYQYLGMLPLSQDPLPPLSTANDSQSQRLQALADQFTQNGILTQVPDVETKKDTSSCSPHAQMSADTKQLLLEIAEVLSDISAKDRTALLRQKCKISNLSALKLATTGPTSSIQIPSSIFASSNPSQPPNSLKSENPETVIETSFHTDQLKRPVDFKPLLEKMYKMDFNSEEEESSEQGEHEDVLSFRHSAETLHDVKPVDFEAKNDEKKIVSEHAEKAPEQAFIECLKSETSNVLETTEKNVFETSPSKMDTKVVYTPKKQQTYPFISNFSFREGSPDLDDFASPTKTPVKGERISNNNYDVPFLKATLAEQSLSRSENAMNIHGTIEKVYEEVDSSITAHIPDGMSSAILVDTAPVGLAKSPNRLKYDSKNDNDDADHNDMNDAEADRLDILSGNIPEDKEVAAALVTKAPMLINFGNVQEDFILASPQASKFEVTTNFSFGKDIAAAAEEEPDGLSHDVSDAAMSTIDTEEIMGKERSNPATKFDFAGKLSQSPHVIEPSLETVDGPYITLSLPVENNEPSALFDTGQPGASECRGQDEEEMDNVESIVTNTGIQEATSDQQQSPIESQSLFLPRNAQDESSNDWLDIFSSGSASQDEMTVHMPNSIFQQPLTGFIEASPTANYNKPKRRRPLSVFELNKRVTSHDENEYDQLFAKFIKKKRASISGCIPPPNSAVKLKDQDLNACDNLHEQQCISPEQTEFPIHADGNNENEKSVINTRETGESKAALTKEFKLNRIGTQLPQRRITMPYKTKSCSPTSIKVTENRRKSVIPLEKYTRQKG